MNAETWKIIAFVFTLFTFLLLSLRTVDGGFVLNLMPFVAVTLIVAIAAIVFCAVERINKRTESAKHEILQSLIKEGVAEVPYFPDEPN